MYIYCKEKLAADKVELADTFFKRLVGLIGKKNLMEGEGLLLTNCPAVHCFFMKTAIDAVYLTKDFTVLWIETLKPWRKGSHIKKTKHILELAEGTASEFITVGDKLDIVKDRSRAFSRSLHK